MMIVPMGSGSVPGILPIRRAVFLMMIFAWIGRLPRIVQPMKSVPAETVFRTARMRAIPVRNSVRERRDTSPVNSRAMVVMAGVMSSNAVRGQPVPEAATAPRAARMPVLTTRKPVQVRKDIKSVSKRAADATTGLR